MTTVVGSYSVLNSKLVIRITSVAEVAGSFLTNVVLAVGLSLMDTSLTSLPKFFLTTIDSAHERFLPGVGIRMLVQVLLQRKLLGAPGMRALELLLDLVELHMTLEAVLGFELCLAIQYVTQVELVHL